MRHILTLLTPMLFLSFNQASASPWSGGSTPNWVLECQSAEYNRTVPLLREYNKCDSKGYTAYFDNLQHYMALNHDGTYSVANEIQSVHVVVTDIKLDRNIPATALCEDNMCYRAMIFINGDSQSGRHVATWVTSPGVRWTDGSGGNYTPESLEVFYDQREPNQNDFGHFKLQLDREMGLAGIVTGKVPGYYIMDHYVNSENEDMGWATFYHYGIAFHSSFTVNGRTASHGCTRLKYLEAKRMNFLARHVQRNFTVETRFTEREALTEEERRAVSYLDLAALNLEESRRLNERANDPNLTEEERQDARNELSFRNMEAGGLY